MAEVQVQSPQTPEQALALLQETIRQAKERIAKEQAAAEEQEKIQRIAKAVADILAKERKEKTEKEVHEQMVEEHEIKKEIEAKVNVDVEKGKTIAKRLQEIVEKPAATEEELEFHQFNDDLYLGAALMKVDVRELPEYKEFVAGKHPVAKKIEKALSASVTGYGAEWAPTGFSTTFIERVETERVLRKLHQEVPIPRGVKSLDIGAAGAAISVFYYPSAESSQDEVPKIPAQTAATRKVTLTPKAIACRVLIPEAYEMSCALPIAQIYRDEMVKAYARGIDNLFINGDTNSSPLDSDLTSSLDVRKVADGYRRITETNNNKADGGTLTVNLIRARLAAMGNYSSPNDCILLTSWQGFWALLSVTEVVNWIQYNAKPLIPTPNDMGKMPDLGLDVVVSDQVRSDLNASGVYDGVATTKTLILIVNRRAFIVGVRRELTLKQATDPETGRDILIAYAYLDFEPAYATTEKVTGLLYNVA